MVPKSIQAQFWRHVNTNGGPDACWPWMRSTRGKGYGQATLDGRQQPAHRLAYAFTYGPIPKGLLVCHRCDNPPCVNPSHLFLGTHIDNARDMVAKGRCHPPKLKGQAHGKSKLTESDVLSIRADTRPERVIAAEYGLCRRHVGCIRRHESWKHLT